jgi:hypothetical protein
VGLRLSLGWENGSAEDWNIAEKQAPTVLADFAKFTRVCI